MAHSESASDDHRVTSGCVTNPPGFDFHLNNWGTTNPLPVQPVRSDHGRRLSDLQDHRQGNGYVGMPGGSNSPDRFIRASLYSRDATQPRPAPMQSGRPGT